MVRRGVGREGWLEGGWIRIGCIRWFLRWGVWLGLSLVGCCGFLVVSFLVFDKNRGGAVVWEGGVF